MAKKNDPTVVSVTGRYMGGAIYSTKTKVGKEEYSANIVLDEGQEEKAQKAIDAARIEEWGNKKPPGFTDWGVRYGDDEEFENSFGHHFINPKASPDKPPSTTFKNAEGILEHYAGIYPGCFVVASLRAYVYKANKEKNIKAGAAFRIRGLMFLKNGDRMGDTFKGDEFDDYESEIDVENDEFSELM